MGVKSMMTFKEYKNEHEKIEIEVLLDDTAHWNCSIDESITKLQEIKKKFKGQIVEMELDTIRGRYGDRDYASIGFFTRREENDEEFDKRMQFDYKWYVKEEENNLKIYDKMKKKLEE